jgi:hypothetical protein
MKTKAVHKHVCVDTYVKTGPTYVKLKYPICYFGLTGRATRLKSSFYWKDVTCNFCLMKKKR